ncbi:Glucan 1,3-beta-glucosidase 3 [Maudiozyma exigua]|uniref:Glucan 1,3-beta-glucosidase 3 n=1 Tax=Maudiozyma exigua TaxID=34358 RepID=A0A9P6VVU8_MAUEX|nr:Glucan 1,3-beta-glucosidase 3 [Kazachstania exigua]
MTLFKFFNSDSSAKETVNLSDSLAIDRRAIFRNRVNYGVNLGSLFVLESWIYDDLFKEVGGGNSEFEAVSKCKTQFGAQATGNKLRQHYESYLNKIDWNFLKNVNVTSLRVPIGYWHVNNGSFLNGLPFQPVADVYASAQPWTYFKTLVKTAGQYDISIVIDVHGLPGGANSEAHSGMVQNPAVFFKTPNYVNAMCNGILPIIVHDICLSFENIAGLQIVNEAYFDNNANDIKAYYLRATSNISKMDNNLPIIISDGWWPQQWSDWVSQNNISNNIIIDSHVYRCFSNEDKSKDAGAIYDSLPQTVQFDKGKADFMVGEFSCVLDEETWKRTKGDRNVHITKFGRAQTSLFPTIASFGWFFWTLQFKWGDGGEWGFVPQVSKNNLIMRSKNVKPIDSNRVAAIIAEHINYWNGKGSYFEHWRFEDAIRQAVYDIQSFNSLNNSRLGRWKSWTSRRRREYIGSKGDSQFMWEWDQGYQRGLDEFNQ